MHLTCGNLQMLQTAILLTHRFEPRGNYAGRLNMFQIPCSFAITPLLCRITFIKEVYSEDIPQTGFPLHDRLSEFWLFEQLLQHPQGNL